MGRTGLDRRRSDSTKDAAQRELDGEPIIEQGVLTPMIRGDALVLGESSTKTCQVDL